jgi:hypothetical protein
MRSAVMRIDCLTSSGDSPSGGIDVEAIGRRHGS